MTEEQLVEGNRLSIGMRALKSDIVELQEVQKKGKFFLDVKPDSYMQIPVPTNVARAIIADLIAENQKEYDKLKKQLEEL